MHPLNINVPKDHSAEIAAENELFDVKSEDPKLLRPKQVAQFLPRIFELVRDLGQGRWELTCDKCGTKHRFSWFQKIEVMHSWKECCQENALLFCREVGRWRNPVVNPTPGVDHG